MNSDDKGHGSVTSRPTKRLTGQLNDQPTEHPTYQHTDRRDNMELTFPTRVNHNYKIHIDWSNRHTELKLGSSGNLHTN